MSVKKRIEELNRRFADKLSEKGVSADASDTTTELINKIDEIEVGIKVDPYVGDYVAEPTITDQKFPTKNLLMLDDFVVKKIPSELLAKEEQEKSLAITKNGTYEVLPDENKVLSSVELEVDVKDETLAEIETTIDSSGVLDSTDGTVEEKVEQLIDVAKLFYLTNVVRFGRNGVFPLESITVNCKNLQSLSQAFFNCNGLKNIYLSNTQKVSSWSNCFYGSAAIETIETLDLSSTGNNEINSQNWIKAPNLKNLKIEPQTIKKTVTFWACSLLTAESIQSIIDGLATVETTQTLTLHADIVLTDEQKATINAKGWTLAQ